MAVYLQAYHLPLAAMAVAPAPICSRCPTLTGTCLLPHAHWHTLAGTCLLAHALNMLAGACVAHAG